MAALTAAQPLIAPPAIVLPEGDWAEDLIKAIHKTVDTLTPIIAEKSKASFNYSANHLVPKLGKCLKTTPSAQKPSVKKAIEVGEKIAESASKAAATSAGTIVVKAAELSKKGSKAAVNSLKKCSKK